jgi:hypothetical protein
MTTVADVAKTACRLSRNDPVKDIDAFNDACAHVIDGHHYICDTDDPWDFLQASGQLTTVGGADVYSLDDLAATWGFQTIKRVLAIVDDQNGGTPLQPMHWMVLERKAGSTQAGDRGAPVAWAPVGTHAIRLWPVPTGGQLLGALFEFNTASMQPDTPVLLPSGYAATALATWAAARMWEQHAGVEARMMADRLDRRHSEAMAKMRDAHGTVRWPYLTFAEAGYMADPQVAIRGGSYQGTVY